MKKIVTQSVLALAILAGVVAVWIAYVPAALPLLARTGLLHVLGIDAAAMDKPATDKGRPGGSAAGPVAVIAAPAVMLALNDQITAIGDGRPLRSVTLLPEVTGVLAEVNVNSGAYVAAGAVVATLRDEAQRIARDRALLMLGDAQAAMTRLETLGNSGAVTDLQRQNARLVLQTAGLELREAELELARRRIIAPISGWVGILAVEPGDQVTASTALVQIDDRAQVLVEFRIPERFVARIAEGDAMTATPLARPDQMLQGHISAIDNRVDQTSRTLRVQATLENADDTLRAGMAFSIALSFQGDEYPAVAPLAIQWSSDGSFIWVIRDGKAAREPVKIMQRNSDTVLVAGNIAAGDLVVTEGVQSLRPGAEVAPRVVTPDEAVVTPAVLPATTTEG